MLAKIAVDWSVVWHTNCEPFTVPTVTLGDPVRPVAVPVQLPDDPVTLPVTLPVIVLVALIVVHVIPPAVTVPTVTLGDPVRPVAGPEKLAAVTAPVNEADAPETAPVTVRLPPSATGPPLGFRFSCSGEFEGPQPGWSCADIESIYDTLFPWYILVLTQL